MLRSGLVAIALLALLGTARAADYGCEKFAWSLARDRAAFAAPDKTTVAAGETLAALSAGALLIRLQQGAQASFEMPPERKPRTEQWHGGMVRLPALPKPGIYQITLSDDAWIDVIAERPLRPLRRQHRPQRLHGRAQERAARSRCKPGRAAGEWRGGGYDRRYDRSRCNRAG